MNFWSRAAAMNARTHVMCMSVWDVDEDVDESLRFFLNNISIGLKLKVMKTDLSVRPGVVNLALF